MRDLVPGYRTRRAQQFWKLPQCATPKARLFYKLWTAQVSSTYREPITEGGSPPKKIIAGVLDFERREEGAGADELDRKTRRRSRSCRRRPVWGLSFSLAANSCNNVLEAGMF
ncbi:hypothetical protein NDU88_005499 [Pleurodeles waltl]|uniref:Uncharacterized protein n=1 Tax=Pleurodeles waltl TaxID=8319 RepID=A0AAV7MES9_PLEWA|nr:hypothetical protein NDU88_005499 [Pleurodeles waltl]